MKTWKMAIAGFAALGLAAAPAMAQPNPNAGPINQSATQTVEVTVDGMAEIKVDQDQFALTIENFGANGGEQSAVPATLSYIANTVTDIHVTVNEVNTGLPNDSSFYIVLDSTGGTWVLPGSPNSPGAGVDRVIQLMKTATGSFNTNNGRTAPGTTVPAFEGLAANPSFSTGGVDAVFHAIAGGSAVPPGDYDGVEVVWEVSIP